MKVKIGPYPNWFGPYQLCDLLRFIGVSEKTRRNWASKINEKPFQWFHDTFQKRKVKIRIDYYDVWSMDHTLALIILPMLKLLKVNKHGSPIVDDEDVPEELRRTSAPPCENEWDTDEFFHARWDWVMNEMIWAFEMISTDDDWEHNVLITGTKDETGRKIMWETHKKTQERISNGFRLFGKYYQDLWD